MRSACFSSFLVLPQEHRNSHQCAKSIKSETESDLLYDIGSVVTLFFSDFRLEKLMMNYRNEEKGVTM